MNRHSSKRRTVSDEPVTLSDQLRDFCHRNLNWFLVAGLSLLLLQDIFGTHGLVAMRRSQKESERVQKEIDKINQENRQLEERVKALKTDPQTIERIAREEMGLARPGEYIFKIPPQPGEASAPSSPPAAHAPKKP